MASERRADSTRPADDPERFLSTTEVARLLHVAVTTVSRWAREGRLPFHLTLGGHHRFHRAEIEAVRKDLERLVAACARTGKPHFRSGAVADPGFHSDKESP